MCADSQVESEVTEWAVIALLLTIMSSCTCCKGNRNLRKRVIVCYFFYHNRDILLFGGCFERQNGYGEGLHLIIYIGEAAEESRAVALGLRVGSAWGKRLAKDAQGCTQ